MLGVSSISSCNGQVVSVFRLTCPKVINRYQSGRRNGFEMIAFSRVAERSNEFGAQAGCRFTGFFFFPLVSLAVEHNEIGIQLILYAVSSTLPGVVVGNL